jgi:hypothetical protein
LAPFCTSRRHGQRFSLLCAYVYSFKLPHARHIRQPFSGFSGISNTHSNLGFGIPLLHRLILLAFLMLILWVVRLTEKALPVHVIFSNLLLFVGLLTNNLCCTIHHRDQVCSCCFQIFWIVHTMRDYGVTYKSVSLMCNSFSAICLAQNPVFQRRVKHIKMRHHFLREQVEKGDIEMKYIDTERQLTDIVITRSEIVGTKPPYVCPGCFIHTYSNNMITRFHVQ